MSTTEKKEEARKSSKLRPIYIYILVYRSQAKVLLALEYLVVVAVHQPT
jgi:hypothetical protein